MSEGKCVVCRRRAPTRDHVCEADRELMGHRLGDLPRMVNELRLQLVPTATGESERVTTSRTHASAPARLDALSLLAPGNEAVTVALHPRIRRWSTTRTVNVTIMVGGAHRAGGQQLLDARPKVVQRTITDWHAEPETDTDGAPVLVAPDDQIGTLPPAEWLASWVGAWRAHFGHHAPRPRGPVPVGTHRQMVLDTFGQVATARDAVRARDAAGAERPTDPLAAEWDTRFGDNTVQGSLITNMMYLLRWLDAACDADVAIREFAAELAALHADLTRVLGEHPDQQWLGRCPTPVMDPETGVERACAAGLWQDPHASIVVCPRCHSSWGPEKVHLLRLAAGIRRVWPIDRRRRYQADEINELTGSNPNVPSVWPKCPTCGTGVAITWREVTATVDTARWWRPDKAECPKGCPEAARTL